MDIYQFVVSKETEEAPEVLIKLSELYDDLLRKGEAPDPDDSNAMEHLLARARGLCPEATRLQYATFASEKIRCNS